MENTNGKLLHLEKTRTKTKRKDQDWNCFFIISLFNLSSRLHLCLFLFHLLIFCCFLLYFGYPFYFTS